MEILILIYNIDLLFLFLSDSYLFVYGCVFYVFSGYLN